MSDTVVFSDLRDANVARQAAWCPDQMPDLSFRGNELAGEVGEVCNVIKKLERERLGWRGSRDTVEHLAQELADVVICTDLVAITAGIDLPAVVAAKFNATSESNGLPQRLVLNRDADPQVMATAPLDVPILVWWPIVAIDEESGDLTDREVGGRWLVTEWNGGHWLEPDVLNALNSNAFDDDMEYARDPRCWIPLPIASGIALHTEMTEAAGHTDLMVTPEAIDALTTPISIGYTNWRGDYGLRTIMPMRLWFGSTEWHPTPQWFLKAWDTEKDVERDFAIVDIGLRKAFTVDNAGGMYSSDNWESILEIAKRNSGEVARLIGAEGPVSRAALDVLAERRRQLEAEGWTPEHDDAHDQGEIEQAAAAYSYAASGPGRSHGRLWPWEPKWWKPGPARQMLVKAGALVIAAIEKIDRREARETSHG